MPPIGRFFPSACTSLQTRPLWLALLMLCALIQPLTGAAAQSPADPPTLQNEPGTIPPPDPGDTSPAPRALAELNLSARESLLTRNSATQVTITVTAGAQDPQGGIIVALTLPEGYLTAAGNQSTRWAVSPLAAGETERFRVVIKATDDRNRLPTAVPVTATLHTGVRILDQQTLYFGIVARQGGRPETVPTVVQTAPRHSP